jgi:SAM-dependent methyltransferase
MCPVCASRDFHFIRKYRSDKAIFREMDLVVCNACGMVYAAPMPSDEVLTEYNSSYFVTAHGGLNTNPAAKSFFSGIAWIRIHHIGKYIQKWKLGVKHILEIGPGSGYLAGNWLHIHPDHQYSAVETDASCHSSLRELGVKLTDIAEVKTSKTLFDLVILSHVVEHVSRPKEFLATVSDCIHKNGMIFIEVPCRDWEHKPEDEPHLLFFEKGPMMQLLTSLGFKNIQLSYHGQTIEKLKQMSRVPSFLERVKRKIIQRGFAKFASLFFTGNRKHMSPAEIVAVEPFRAHVESGEPAWWLRAVAQKG